MQMLRVLIAVLAGLSGVGLAQRTNADRYFCPGPTAAPADRRTDKTKLSVATFNAEWLFDGYGDSKTPWGSVAGHTAHMREIGDVINALDIDVVNIPETEDCYMLEQLVGYMASGHEGYIIKGTDTATGQNLGLLTKVDPTGDLNRTKIRAVYPLPGSTCGFCGSESQSSVSKHYVTHLDLGSGNKVMVVGVHFVSQLNGERSCSQREAQAVVTRQLIRDNLRPGEEVIVLGDFNDFSDIAPGPDETFELNPNPSDVFAIIRQSLADQCQPLYNVGNLQPVETRYTTDVGGSIGRSNIDHILVSEGLRPFITSVQYANDAFSSADGISDHWPVIVRFDFDRSPAGFNFCPSNCNDRGWCNHYSGICECETGYGGADCSVIETECKGLTTIFVPTVETDPDSMTKPELVTECQARGFDSDTSRQAEYATLLRASYQNELDGMARAELTAECVAAGIDGEAGDRQEIEANLVELYLATLDVAGQCLARQVDSTGAAGETTTKLSGLRASELSGKTKAFYVQECQNVGLDCDAGFTNAERETTLQDHYDGVLAGMTLVELQAECQTKSCICDTETQPQLTNRLEALEVSRVQLLPAAALQAECSASVPSCVCGNTKYTNADINAKVMAVADAARAAQTAQEVAVDCQAAQCYCGSLSSPELVTLIKDDITREIQEGTIRSYCNGNGACDTQTLQCVCSKGWSGVACEYIVPEGDVLEDGSLFPDQVFCVDDILVYELPLSKGDRFTLTVDVAAADTVAVRVYPVSQPSPFSLTGWRPNPSDDTLSLVSQVTEMHHVDIRGLISGSLSFTVAIERADPADPVTDPVTRAVLDALGGGGRPEWVDDVITSEQPNGDIVVSFTVKGVVPTGRAITATECIDQGCASPFATAQDACGDEGKLLSGALPIVILTIAALLLVVACVVLWLARRERLNQQSHKRNTLSTAHAMGTIGGSSVSNGGGKDDNRVAEGSSAGGDNTSSDQPWHANARYSFADTTHHDLEMTANPATTSAGAHGQWIALQDEQGNQYWFNETTQVSQWEKPTAEQLG